MIKLTIITHKKCEMIHIVIRQMNKIQFMCQVLNSIINNGYIHLYVRVIFGKCEYFLNSFIFEKDIYFWKLVAFSMYR